MTEFEKADVDGNGSIDQAEWDRMAFEDKRLKMLDDDAQRDAQRKMAWFALFGMLLYPFAIILCNVADLDEAMKSLASIAGVYFVLLRLSLLPSTARKPTQKERRITNDGIRIIR